MENRVLRQLPAVDRVLAEPVAAAAAAAYSRREVVGAVRSVIDELRARLRAGETADVEPGAVAAMAVARLGSSLRRVVNATGVVLHTNLGRAPLPAAAGQALLAAALGYVNLEYDLADGRRTAREEHITGLLCRLTGAQEAMVVNNNAAAVLLALNTLACGREVIVSRGQLVEIGGSFRLPEVMAAGGCRLVEVGTTNRTYLSDYAGAITDRTAVLLRVHPSNFVIRGYQHQPAAAELAALARERGLVFMEDLGSGLLLDLPGHGERTVQAALADGAEVVTFSGDKLLGGPQAGLLAGGACIGPMRKNPLARALRVDKLTLSALEATLRLYYDPARARTAVPALAALTDGPEVLRTRARRLARRLRQVAGGRCAVRVQPVTAPAGGGSLPGTELPGYGIVLTYPGGAAALEAALRRAPTPVVARVVGDGVVLDVRTIADEEQPAVAAALAHALGTGERS